MPENPFQPPGVTPTRAHSSTGLDKLRLPAIVMIGVTIVGLLNILLGLAIRGANGDLSLNPRNLIFIALLFLAHGVYLYGSYLMLKAKDHEGRNTRHDVCVHPHLLSIHNTWYASCHLGLGCTL